MKGRQSAHGRFRELIAARLDGPLTRAELRSLIAHLKACTQCRQVDREYREQRERLHSLPAPIPPRDLWARTSSALDREVARGSYRRPGYRRIFGRRRSRTPVAALVTSIAAVGLAAVLIVLQFGPSFPRSPAAQTALPTPFSVSPQSVAFIGSNNTNDTGDQEVAIYRAQVSQVCPPSAPDCYVDEGIERTSVVLPGNVRPKNVALSPSGNQLVLVGREQNEDVIAVVTLPRRQSSGGGSEPTDQPSTPSGPDGPSTEPRDSGNGTPTEPPATRNPSDPTDEPAPSPSAPPDVVSILEDVQSTGSPPAWSPNSETLAFSAMPADGSHGPDVYVWSVGDDQARAVTDDHSSFFASWSGRRIVVSRLAETNKSEATVETVVIDPATLEERVADVAPIWLPAVNPGRTHAAAWYGDLHLVGGLPDPQAGALYLLDWAKVDPFAPGAPEPTPEPTDEPTPEPTVEPTPEPTAEPTPEPTAEPTDERTSEPSADPTDAPSVRPSVRPSPRQSVEPSRQGEAGLGAGAATPKPRESIDAAPADPPRGSDGSNEPADPFDPTDVPEGLVAINPNRDPLTDPVVDWQALWSGDGEVLGIWIADVPGSTWGQLIVRALNRAEVVALNPDTVVAPTLAQRGFSLGLSRVAWVAPTDSDANGELRIKTWGSDGEGGLRLRPQDVQVVPTF